MGFPEGVSIPGPIEGGMGRTGNDVALAAHAVEEDPSPSKTHASASSVARSKMRRAVGDVFSSTTG
jgi:hypothetical protein